MNSSIADERRLNQARHLERQGKTQEALELYGAVLKGPLPADDPLRLSAEREQSILRGGGDFGDRFEFHLRHFFQEATKPSTLIPVLAGSAVFQVSRFALLSRLAAMPAGALTRAWGAKALGFALPFGAELSTFVLASHGLRVGPRDWASAALSLGLLKASGGLAQSTARALPLAPALFPKVLGATALVGGLFTAGRIEEALGWRQPTRVGDAVFDAMVAASSLSLGTRLAQRLLGSKLAGPLREMELRLQQSQERLSLVQPAFAMAGGGKLSPIFMATGEGRFGGGGGESPLDGVTRSVRELAKATPGRASYIMIYFQNSLARLKPEQVSQFLIDFDRILNVAPPRERAAMLPAWWETLRHCDPKEIGKRVAQYTFWLKKMGPEEIPALATALFEISDRLEPAAFNRLAALSLKRTLLEARRGIEFPADWAEQLYGRLTKSSRESFLKTLRGQMRSEEIWQIRNALDMLRALGPRLEAEKMMAWTREMLGQVTEANSLVQTSMWRSIQALMEQIPAAERPKLLPALRKALAAEREPHPSPFFFVTLQKALDSLDPASANLLEREMILRAGQANPGIAKGLILSFEDRLDKIGPQNRELLIRQLELLLDSENPDLRHGLLVRTPTLKTFWEKLDPIEQAALRRHWEQGLAAADPEKVLRQTENLRFTAPREADRQVELFLKLDERAAAKNNPPGLSEALAIHLHAMGSQLPSEVKAQLIAAAQSRRAAPGPFPMAGYLFRGLSHPETPALIQALSMKDADWPVALAGADYPREFTDWQRQIFTVTGRDIEMPRVKPVTIDLSEVLPYHYVFREKDPGQYLKTIEGIRERIFRSLILQGWRPGQLPADESLRRAITTTEQGNENYPPLLAAPAASGVGLLMNGHHRLSSLLSLVAEGYLPIETLRRLPFERIEAISSQAILDEALGRENLPDFGWGDVLAFHPPSLVLLKRLGYENKLGRAFR